MASKEINLGGRPTIYTEELATDILAHIVEGLSVSEICRIEGMPSRATVMSWVAQDREGFLDRYTKACHARAFYWADEILHIADDGTNDWMVRNDSNGDNSGWKENGEAIQRSRLRVDSRKWLVSKLLPQYSDKQEIKHSGNLDVNRITDDELNAKIQALML